MNYLMCALKIQVCVHLLVELAVSPSLPGDGLIDLWAVEYSNYLASIVTRTTQAEIATVDIQWSELTSEGHIPLVCPVENLVADRLSTVVGSGSKMGWNQFTNWSKGYLNSSKKSGSKTRKTFVCFIVSALHLSVSRGKHYSWWSTAWQNYH
jgi:hypothetical protein